MLGRVLVVEDVLPNVKFLEAKLSGEYFDVLLANSGPGNDQHRHCLEQRRSGYDRYVFGVG